MHLYLIWCLPDHSDQPESLHHKSVEPPPQKNMQRERLANKQGRH